MLEAVGTLLEPDDITSRGMGQNGEDVILSPAARKIYPWYVEAKNTEKLNVVGVFNEHYNKYKHKNKSLISLVHTKNRNEPLITLRFEDFMEIYKLTMQIEKTTDEK
jgi:hypothetical protein